MILGPFGTRQTLNGKDIRSGPAPATKQGGRRNARTPIDRSPTGDLDLADCELGSDARGALLRASRFEVRIGLVLQDSRRETHRTCQVS